MHHHTKQLVKKLSDGAFPPENIPPHYGLGYTPDFFIEYLTQNIIFHVKSHVTKHVF